MPKERVIVLGAGPSGLAAAFGLSATPELRERYDVTVFQVGWRAGGKCSTGRYGSTNRIEQNGTHYLFGCYQNSFKIVREAYEELELAGDLGFGTFDEAFIPRNLLVFKQFFRGGWHTWPIVFPTNDTVPGTRYGHLPPATQYLSMALQWLLEGVLGWRALQLVEPDGPFSPGFRQPRWLYTLLKPARMLVSGTVDLIGVKLLRKALRIVRDMEAGRIAEREGQEAIAWICKVVRRWAWWLLGSQAKRSLKINRALLMADFGCTVIIGVVADEVLRPLGLARLDRFEFREWLERHGAHELTRYAPFVTTWYDAVAAYDQGDVARPNLAAGVSLNAIGHAALAYDGSFAYQMRAEIGDSFVAPIFECLRKRGVRFRFFHRVWDVIPEGDRIAAVKVEQQVRLKSGDPDSYEPFITVDGLKAWPGEPLWDQIHDPGDAPKHNLESFYTSWRGTVHTLEAGKDFDKVILALPVDCLRFYCRSLLEGHPDWRRMVDQVYGVETQSLRLWFSSTLEDMGWKLGPPILSGYADPFQTWEDNGHLVEVETWPPDARPHAMATVFGPLPAPAVPPGPNDHEYPCKQQDVANANALHFMQHEVGALWPGATRPDDPTGVDWDLLIDLEHRAGKERMEAQYVRSNAGPVERYTMAKAGATGYRLGTDESGYSNLYLTGDWIRNGVTIGSVEGAVVAGFLTSRAISGHPHRVVPDQLGFYA